MAADQPLVDRDEAAAALAARAELGSELEPQVIDAFVERVEKRLDERVEQELARRRKTDDLRAAPFVVALASLGTGIPITAVAVSAEGLPGLAIAWLGIALVNLFVARAR